MVLIRRLAPHPSVPMVAMPGVPLHGSFSYKKSKKDKTHPNFLARKPFYRFTFRRMKQKAYAAAGVGIGCNDF
jgi:hypothetical protein